MFALCHELLSMSFLHALISLLGYRCNMACGDDCCCIVECVVQLRDHSQPGEYMPLMGSVCCSPKLSLPICSRLLSGRTFVCVCLHVCNCDETSGLQICRVELFCTLRCLQPCPKNEISNHAEYEESKSHMCNVIACSMVFLKSEKHTYACRAQHTSSNSGDDTVTGGPGEVFKMQYKPPHSAFPHPKCPRTSFPVCGSVMVIVRYAIRNSCSCRQRCMLLETFRVVLQIRSKH